MIGGARSKINTSNTQHTTMKRALPTTDATPEKESNPQPIAQNVQ